MKVAPRGMGLLVYTYDTRRIYSRVDMPFCFCWRMFDKGLGAYAFDHGYKTGAGIVILLHEGPV